jgi:hypothetical protein
MDKNQNDNRNQPTEGMLKEKTNQDFNKQKPDPKDPIQNKKHQIGEDDEEENDRREITANIGDNMDNDRNREEDESDDSVDQVTNNSRDQKNRDEESDSFRSENRTENQNTNKGRL